jgi:site-specific recombinase XerC
MPRATTKVASLADGPALASTRDYWILHLRSEGKSERTVSTYPRALDRLDAFLVERGMPRAPGAIRRGHLEAFFVALGELGHAPATNSILFRALRPFWRWLVEEDEIERTPMDRCWRVRCATRPSKRCHLTSRSRSSPSAHRWSRGPPVWTWRPRK